MMRQNSELLVVVHDGVFHADDVLCIALLKFAGYEFRYKRTRNADIINSADFVLDVGGEDVVTTNRVVLDHHSEPREAYDNSCIMAACGKLAKYLWESGDEKDVAWLKYLRTNLLYGVEAADNGQDSSEYGGNKLAFVSMMMPTWLEASSVDTAFDEAVSMVYSIVKRCYAGFLASYEAKAVVSSAISIAEDGICLLPRFCPWQNWVIEHNNTSEKKIKIIVFKNMNGKYNVQVVPVAHGTFESIISLPASWRGKRDSDLSAASGIEGGIFCHPAGFMAIFETSEEAYEAAKKAVAMADE